MFWIVYVGDKFEMTTTEKHLDICHQHHCSRMYDLKVSNRSKLNNDDSHVGDIDVGNVKLLTIFRC